MSQNGIQLAAGVFQQMQMGREKLIRLGCGEVSQNGLRFTPIDKQDVLLGHMFSKANDAIKDDFMRIVSGRYPDGSGYIDPKFNLTKKG